MRAATAAGSIESKHMLQSSRVLFVCEGSAERVLVVTAARSQARANSMYVVCMASSAEPND